MLTAKQRDLLEFLRACQKNSHTPSYDEMKEYLGLASKSGVHRLVAALEERGFIHRLPNRARSISVLSDGVHPREVMSLLELIGTYAKRASALEAENRNLRDENKQLREEVKRRSYRKPVISPRYEVA